MKRTSYSDMVDHSINDSSSRTIITSITTFLVVLILFLFGGEVIHSFAFAMLIGVVVGTYSSMYVACPIVVQLHKGIKSWVVHKILTLKTPQKRSFLFQQIENKNVLTVCSNLPYLGNNLGCFKEKPHCRNTGYLWCRISFFSRRHYSPFNNFHQKKTHPLFP